MQNQGNNDLLAKRRCMVMVLDLFVVIPQAGISLTWSQVYSNRTFAFGHQASLKLAICCPQVTRC